MRMNRFLMPLLVLPLLIGGTTGQQSNVTRADGGSIRTSLGHGIVLNEDSSLQREWIAVHHDAVPVSLEGTPGVKTIYESGSRFSSGGFKYSASFQIEAKEPLAAVEIRFLTFDIWGEHSRSLNLTEIRDLPAGTHKLDGKWNLFSENEASEYYASIAYISRVRTQDGRVIASPIEPVVAEARKFSEKFTESDLEPPEAKPSAAE